MTEVLIGTSGYSYRDWEGAFYPEGMKQKEYLGYYCSKFPVCELNYSYYKMPNRAQIYGFLEKTPQDFLFCVKAHGSLTHERGKNWKDSARDLYQALLPMAETGRLASLLVQFPFSFHHNKANRLYLSELAAELAGLPLAVEFRNREWMLEKVYEGCAERGICWVQTDLPDLDNLPLPTSRTTGETGYIRFHGRNRENWWTGDNTSRYDYLYKPRELETWLCRIEEMAPRIKRLIITFNNHHKGRAVRNAFELYSLLKGFPDLDIKPLGEPGPGVFKVT